MNSGVERAHRAAQPVDRERGRDVRRARQAFGAGNGQRRHRGRWLRAVDERQPFLGAQRDRREPRGGECLTATYEGHRVADPGLTLADEDERQVGKRREIATRANRAAARHARVDAVVEEVQQPLERRAPDAREALGQDVRPQRHRGTDGSNRQGVTDAGGVAAQEVHLQRAERVTRDG